MFTLRVPYFNTYIWKRKRKLLIFKQASYLTGKQRLKFAWRYYSIDLDILKCQTKHGKGSLTGPLFSSFFPTTVVNYLFYKSSYLLCDRHYFKMSVRFSIKFTDISTVSEFLNDFYSRFYQSSAGIIYLLIL